MRSFGAHVPRVHVLLGHVLITRPSLRMSVFTFMGGGMHISSATTMAPMAIPVGLSATVNGQRIPGPSTVEVRQGVVHVNGKPLEGQSTPSSITIAIDGSIQGPLQITGGGGPISVTVKGDAASVRTETGDIHVNGAVHGSVITQTGDVTAGSVDGDASSQTGDVMVGRSSSRSRAPRAPMAHHATFASIGGANIVTHGARSPAVVLGNLVYHRQRETPLGPQAIRSAGPRVEEVVVKDDDDKHDITLIT